MPSTRLTRICLVPRLSGMGGMVSFQQKLSAGLSSRGVEVCYDLHDPKCQAALVIGGTRDLAGLWRARRKGMIILQRLNGMNWLHRRRRTGVKHFLRAEYGNAILTLIRSRLAHRIVYQSQFSQRWWERVHGETTVPSRVVYNGVDLQVYSPEGNHHRPLDRFQVLLVEASLGGGYEMGLETAFQLVERLQTVHHLPIELRVAGGVADDLKLYWQNRASFPLHFAGKVPAQDIPETDRSAHLLYSADLNAACPNSVVEALACGLPVLAFDTGALSELVGADAGRIVAYGGDPWRLDPPDIPALAEAAVDLFNDQERYRSGARLQAVSSLSLDAMVDQYLEFIQAGL